MFFDQGTWLCGFFGVLIAIYEKTGKEIIQTSNELFCYTGDEVKKLTDLSNNRTKDRHINTEDRHIDKEDRHIIKERYNCCEDDL